MYCERTLTQPVFACTVTKKVKLPPPPKPYIEVKEERKTLVLPVAPSSLRRTHTNAYTTHTGPLSLLYPFRCGAAYCTGRMHNGQTGMFLQFNLHINLYPNPVDKIFIKFIRLNTAADSHSKQKFR